MRTKYNIGDHVLVDVTVLSIEIDKEGNIYYRVDGSNGTFLGHVIEKNILSPVPLTIKDCIVCKHRHSGPGMAPCDCCSNAYASRWEPEED